MSPVAVIGGGVVGTAVAYTLARRGVRSVLLEAEHELALGASGTNSGIVHTGFDSKPGELETRLILRAAELREGVFAEIGAPLERYGAELRPRDEAERRTVRGLAAAAAANGVEVHVDGDGTLAVPGEAVTDPVAYTLALAAAAERGGAELRTGARVTGIREQGEALVVRSAGGDESPCAVAVNCAGLHADELARLAGDDSFSIYPRKGEFFVFEPPGGRPLQRIMLPVPTARTKGVLVFPTLDGKVIAGPTAHDGEDKGDWAVREEAWAEVMPKAVKMLPELEGATPVASYAGLRPAGREGVNYRIEVSPRCGRLINVAAIRSTGLTASLAIGEHVAKLIERRGLARLGHDRALPPAGEARPPTEWWRRRATLASA